MNESISAILIHDTTPEVWQRGVDYVRRHLVYIGRHGESFFHALVEGSSVYKVILKLSADGVLADCTCPYMEQWGGTCKHIVAAAITWDQLRGIPLPHITASTAFAPSHTKRRRSEDIFADPLAVDLDRVRTFPDDTALGGRGRPHSRLPDAPPLADDSTPVTPRELKHAFAQMRQWSRRQAYDPYFCAGEMIAAFCEVVRSMRRRLPATPAQQAAEAVLLALQFHRLLVTQFIDDSAGLRWISGAYLSDLVEALMGSCATTEKLELSDLLAEIFAELRREE